MILLSRDPSPSCAALSDVPSFGVFSAFASASLALCDVPAGGKGRMGCVEGRSDCERGNSRRNL